MGEEAAKKISHVAEGSLSSPGEAEGSNNPQLNLKLGISSTYSAQTSDNQVEKNLINGSSTTHGASNVINFNKPSLDLKLATEKKDLKRLTRIMSNRVSSEKYRAKKVVYVEQLEKLTSALELQTSDIRQQFEETKTFQQSLRIEQNELKLQLEAFEKDKIVKEDEIENNKAEVNRLRELLKANQQAMSNSNGGPNATNAEFDLNL